MPAFTCRLLFFLCLAACLPPAAFPDEPGNGPLAQARDSHLPGPTLGNLVLTYEGESEFDNGASGFGSVSVSVRELALNALAPLILKPEWKLAAGLGLRAYHFSFSSPRLNNKDTYTLNLPLGLWTRLSENWTLAGMLAPSVYTDFENTEIDDCRFAGIAMANYKWTPDLTLSMGASYSRVFGGDLFFPVAGLVWNPDPEWRVSLSFPRPSIWYAPAPRLRFSAWFTPAGSEWGITENLDGRERELNFLFKGWRTGASVEIELAPHLNLEIAGGAAFKRRYELRDRDADESIFVSDVNSTWFVQTGLIIR